MVLDAFPVVEKILANPSNNGAESVQLNCSWVYNGNSSLVEFRVRWIGDKEDTKRRIERDFDGMEQREYFYDFQWSDGNGNFRDSPTTYGYQFNKEV